MVPGAAHWLPYVLLGLVAGVPVDGSRHPLLVTDLGRGLMLTAVPVLALTHRLTVAALMVLMVVPGLMALHKEGPTSRSCPRLVPANLVAERQPAPRSVHGIRGEAPEGLRWVYQHVTLRPLALSAHGVVFSSPAWPELS